RARRTGRRPRRGDHRHPAHVPVRAPRVLPDRGGGRRPREPPRPVCGRVADRHQRHRLQVLASAVRRLFHLPGAPRHPAVAPGRPVRDARVKRRTGYGGDPRVRAAEWLPWLTALVAFFLLPEYLSLGARILTYILFAVSLDLVLGYAGIVTLGH